MAINKNQKRTTKLSELIKKREFTVGVLTVAVVAVGAFLLFRSVAKQAPKVSTIETDKVSFENNKGGMNSPQKPEEKQVSQIKKLADTSGEQITVVQQGDNYWKISERNCATGRYYLTIQAINGNKPLHPGDTVVVTCE